MATTVQFSNPAIVETDGIIRVNFSDGSQLEMQPGNDGLQQYVIGTSPTIDQVRAMAIANRLAADPLLNSPELWNGKSVTLDLEAANPANVFKVV